MLEQFSPAQDTSIGERLLSLRQTGTARAFRRDFIALASNAPEIPNPILEMAFLNGLKPKIKAGVKMMEPRGLQRMMDVAILVEDWSVGETPEETEGIGRGGRSSNGRFQAQQGKPAQQTVQGLNPQKGRPGSITTPLNNASNPKPSHNRLKAPFRRLTPAEVAKWKAEGLCYQCDEKYSWNHKCQKAELVVMMVLEDGTEIDVSNCSVELEEEETTESVEMAEISLNSLVGISSPCTIKLQGTVKNKEVVVLIDSGASHNFISKAVVEELKLATDTTRGYNVLTAGGITIRGDGLCDDLELKLQGCTIVSSFLPLELGSADVILGMQWLETLGDMKVNWKLQTIKFKIEGAKYTMRGDPSLCYSAASLKSILKSIQHDGEAMLVEYNGAQLVESSQGDVTMVPPPLQDMLEEYGDIFAEPEGLPPSRGREHVIVLKNDADPVSVRPFRYPQAQREEIEKQVAAMPAAGIIRDSNSPFSSPVLLVKKKDGSWRFCVDYRALNKATIADCYPIPMIDQLLDELQGAVVFSKLDLKSGYHQILVKAEDVQKMAFRTHDGHYEFLVMPFGLSNAPATFQSLMNEVFRSYLRKFVLVFFDDILVYSRSEEEHEENLKAVLEVLRTHKLYANRKKCEFGSSSIEYLGHIISKDGVAADEGKIRAMVESVEPKTVKELRGFLGLTGYYRKFVQGYGDSARLLTTLLRKDQFKWSLEAVGAFQQLKNAMSTVPVLALPDFSEVFVIESDASGVGLGAVLMQRQRPIAYFS